ncbi:MAG: class I SAM-dependent methyltransferase [Candidatus Puniceispirillaceae bacterium]
MMNSKSVCKYATKRTPDIEINEAVGWNRHDVVNLLEGSENIGIELGVAKGVYAQRMVNSGKFQRFYGVDVYGDTHDTAEYCAALKRIGFQNPGYCLLRMDFDSALGLFEDSYFDFIYIDGFAHTGEEGGKTLVDWVKKLKIGGVLAGDDYHYDWPLVKWAVNDFAAKLGTDLNVTTELEDVDYSRYPTWFIRKKSETKVEVDRALYKIAMKEKKRIHQKYYSNSRFRAFKRKIERLVGKALNLLGIKPLIQRFLREIGYF